MRKSVKITALLLAFALTACGWGEPLDSAVSPSPLPGETVSPSPAGWTVSKKKPGSSIFGIAWDPSDTLSPLLTSNRLNREMYNLIYDSLFVLDETFTPRESLCESMSTNDNRRFSITLRQDVLFHDSQPLTVQDVVSSFQTARSSASPYSSRLSVIDSVAAAGGGVEITLKEPDERFAALLTFPIVKAGDKSHPPAGTGPYVLSGGEGRDYLIPFTDWWRDDALPVGHIELNAADRLEDITYLMSAGDISLVTADANDSFGIVFSGDFDVWEYPTPTMYYVEFNTAHPVLSDKRVRQALSCAFDRERLVSEVFKKSADPAAAAVPPSLYDSGGGYDLVRYTELMAEAGLEDTDNDGILDYASGKARLPLELRFVVDEDDPAALQTAALLGKTLENIGVAATVEALPGAQLAADIEAGAFGLHCTNITLAADFRQTRWGNAATGTSIERQIEAFMDEMPVAPLLFKRGQVLTHRSGVTGIKPVYGNPYVNIYEWTVAQ